jgi:hypothetical protein
VIDRVFILASSRAGSLPQGFMLIADVVYDAETFGSSRLLPRCLRVVIEALQDIRGSIASPSCH